MVSSGSQQDNERAKKQRRKDENSNSTNRPSMTDFRRSCDSNNDSDIASASSHVHPQSKAKEVVTCSRDDTDAEEDPSMNTYSKKRSRTASSDDGVSASVPASVPAPADLTDDEGGPDETTSVTSCPSSSSGGGRRLDTDELPGPDTTNPQPQGIATDPRTLHGNLDIEIRRSRRVRRVGTGTRTYSSSGVDVDVEGPGARYVVFEDLPLEWWERSAGCKEAKALHLAYIDEAMDGVVEGAVGVDGGDETGMSGLGSSSTAASSSGNSSSSSSSSSSSVILAAENDGEWARDGRERLVLLTTLAHQDTVLEANLFPYACPEGIEHFTLWSIKDLSKIEIQDFVDHWILEHLPPRRAYRWQYDDNAGERSILLFHVHVFVETRLPWDSGAVWEVDNSSRSSVSTSCNSSSTSTSSGDSSSSGSDSSDDSSNSISEAAKGHEAPPVSPAARAPALLPLFVPHDGLEYFPPHTIVYQQRYSSTV